MNYNEFSRKISHTSHSINIFKFQLLIFQIIALHANVHVLGAKLFFLPRRRKNFSERNTVEEVCLYIILSINIFSNTAESKIKIKAWGEEKKEVMNFARNENLLIHSSIALKVGNKYEWMTIFMCRVSLSHIDYSIIGIS